MPFLPKKPLSQDFIDFIIFEESDAEKRYLRNGRYV